MLKNRETQEDFVYGLYKPFSIRQKIQAVYCSPKEALAEAKKKGMKIRKIKYVNWF